MEDHLTTMASAMFFGGVFFCTAALTVRTAATGDFQIIRASMNTRSSALDIRSLASVYTLLHHTSVLGLILFYAYLCEYHPPFPHSTKSYDRDYFLFLMAVLFILSFFTWKRHTPAIEKELSKREQPEEASSHRQHRDVALVNDKTEVFNRDQTEEWKGWMQVAFLFYHYFHAEEAYNSIRVFITCYVWMTGFGNFSFFYIKGDYSLVRVLQMIWRLNFLVIFMLDARNNLHSLLHLFVAYILLFHGLCDHARLQTSELRTGSSC
jgi:hypothetical protein